MVILTASLEGYHHPSKTPNEPFEMLIEICEQTYQEEIRVMTNSMQNGCKDVIDTRKGISRCHRELITGVGKVSANCF